MLRIPDNAKKDAIQLLSKKGAYSILMHHKNQYTDQILQRHTKVVNHSEDDSIFR
jgi:hypothetical protein